MMIKLLVATVTLALAVATAKDDEQRYGTPDGQGFARGTVAAVPPDATRLRPWPPCPAKCYVPSCEGDRDERTPRRHGQRDCGHGRHSQ